MNITDKHITLLLSVAIFILFFSYYFFTSNVLPKGAGPDWKSNTDVTKFIYEKGRLAVFPDDEKDLHYTVHGGSRALRPPFSYIVSAITAGIFSSSDIESFILFRKGSALLCALTVALTFYALSLYFLSFRIGIFGAAAIGLMPQFTFIASYNNDDSGAIFSATLLITALIHIYRYGINYKNASFLGLAGGIVILSKVTAWLLLPLVLVFMALFIRASGRSLLRYTAIAGMLFMLAGGWWIAMNMTLYGIDDPILTKLSSTVVEKHRRLAPEMGVGFAAQGVGYYDLLVKNHKDFLGATAHSTIGNLDWLRLKVGSLQYGLYLVIFYIAIYYYLFTLVHRLYKIARNIHLDESEKRQFAFETVLFLMLAFQMFMYTWTNINNIIQIQGKYLIPVFLPLLLLFFSGTRRISELIHKFRNKMSEKGMFVNSTATANTAVLLAGLFLLVSVHWNAWLNYVIPFYQPPAQNIRLANFNNVYLNKHLHVESHNVNLQVTDAGIRYKAAGIDSRVIFNDDLCRNISPNALILMTFHAEMAGTLQFFIDEGTGFSARNSATKKYPQGDNHLIIPVSARHCKRLRFDPFTENSSILLKKLQIAPISISERQN